LNRRWLLATATVQPLRNCKIYLEKKKHLIAYYKYILSIQKGRRTTSSSLPAKNAKKRRLQTSDVKTELDHEEEHMENGKTQIRFILIVT
jgi:hypothetical protein